MLNLNEMAFIFGGKVMNFRDMKRKERWSIRKLTVGAASVLLGTYFVASSQGVAKADTVKDNNVNNNTVNEQTSEKKISQPITPNTQAVVIAKNNHQNSENNTANLQNKADLIRQNNQKIINRLTVQKNTIQKVENSTFSEIKNREAANTQPFNIAENSSKSTTNSNNSLDESTFGKVDVNSWDTETVNNGLNITGYHGSDQEHLVIPNAADFTKAGKLTDENAVITVNAAKFKKILNTVKPITVAISKTDNRKVQVSDKTAFGGNLTTENGVSTNDPNLKQMDLTNLDTSNLTDMSGMFCGAYKVKSLGNLSGWDVSHVTNMQQMFDENTYDSPALESLDGINKWNVSNVQNILCLFRNDTNLKDIDISGWDLSKATGGWTTGQVFASFTNASKTVINLNNVKLPSDFNFATSFANGQVVITNNGDLLQLDTTSKVPFKDNLTFRQYNSWVEYANPTVKTYSHSIFYDSKGSSDAKAIVQDAIDTFLHNNYANYKKITIPTDAVYLSTKPSDSATAIANGTYDIAKTETETSDTTYQVFRDDEIPMQLKYVETDTNKDLGTVTVVGNGITIVTSHSIGLNPLPITNLADWLGNDDYTKSDMSITGQKHFGFDGIAEPVNVEIHLTKKMITEQRTVTIHLYERDSNGDPVKDSNGNYVSVAPDLKATFNYQQDEFVNSKGKVVKKSNIWLWDEKAPKTYDGANSQEVNVGYIEGVQSISNVKCWKVPINKEGTSYILVPNDGNWSTVEFSTPAVDGYYANPFIDNIVNGYPLLGRPANLFVNPRFNNSVRPGTSDASDSSIAYTNQDGIYENKNEHIIWYFPKENTATIKRTINFVKNDASHTQLQETSTQDVNLNGSLVAANPNGTGKDYFTIYPAEYNDASIVTGSPIAVINNSNKPTYSWKAKDGQTSVNTDITGYTVSAVKIGNADYSTNENDIKYAKEIAQNTATLNSPTDLNISFVYAPVSLTSSYQFVDDDNKEQLIAPATSFSGQTGETVELNIKLPDNYELAKGSTLPTSYTFKPSDNEQLKIHLIHQKKVLSDDTRTISRKVTITDPDGKVDPKSMTQSVTFSRSDTLDKVTNQHIYGKWNTKQQALPAIILPVFAGYTPSGEVDAINVTADSNNPADINISYTADKQNSFYKFVDDNENEATVGTSHPISGTTDETIDLTKAIKDSVPTNYDLVPDQNMSYIFKASDNKPLIVHLTHHISAVTNDSNLTKTVSRTINVTKPDGTKLAPVVQRVSFIQTATKDDVTGKVTYNNDWKANGKDSFTEYDAPTVDGYTANPVKIEKLTPDVNTKDSIVNIVYKANPQKISVRFIDDDNQKQQVGSAFIINGVTDGNADFSTVAIPENYVLAEGSKLPTNHKFTANDQTVYTVELRHKTEDAKIDPNAKLSQKVSRTILITNIDGQVNRIVQEHTFTRIGKKDMVTGNINYGSWSENGSYTFAAIPVKNIAGYATSGSAPEIVVTPETKNSTVNISYFANGQTSYYQFIDDDYQVGDPVINQKHNIAGKTGDSINLNITIPENYDLVKGNSVPTTYTFTAEDNKPIVIHLVHQISTLTDDPSLTKLVRRTILITNIDGKVDRAIQEHTFTRTGKKDMVTGNISYGPWSENGKYTFAGIPVKEIAGYAINGSVPEVVVTPETKDSTINISYLANGQTSYYQFIDDDYQTGDPVINQKHPVAGKTDETIKLNISIPENYSLIEGSVLPTSYTFESGNKPIIIHLIHQKESLPNDTKTISRKVTIIDPDGKVDSKSTTQSVTFSRSDVLDKVTNRHTYGEWNKKQETLPAIDLPVFAGYTPFGKVNEIDVTAASHNPSDADIVYNPDRQNSFYQFVDDNENGATVGINYSISGVTAETIDLIKEIKAAIPTNYDLVPDQKMSYTFKASDNDPLIIHLTHHISKVVNDPSLTKTVRRTILITNINGKVDKTVQEHTFTRTGKKDMVTEIIKYGPWSENGKYTFAAIPVKAIEGYAINGSVPEVVVTPETMDSIINIGYVANGQTSYYQFIDDDSQAGDPVINQKHPIAGKTGETIKLNISIPENYDLVKGKIVPTSYTFTAENNKPIVIHLVHQISTVTDNPSLTKTIRRTILITNIDGKVDRTVQKHTFTRTGKKDMVTGNISYGPWSENGKYTFAGIPVKEIAGYAINGSVPEVVVTPETKDSTINISYLANGQTSYYQFIDDDYQTGDPVINQKHPVAGKTDETIKLNISIPENYSLIEGSVLPTSYTFESGNKPIIIHLIHQKESLPNDTKTISRKVTIIDPDGKVDSKSTTQSVTFSRNDILDKVTNKHIYGKWNEAQQTLPSIDLPSFNGYTPTGEVTAAEVTTNSGDIADIIISYVPNEQTSYYEFVDDDNHESLIAPATVISGRTGETIKLNIVTPNGYALAKDVTLPRSYRFKATNNEPIIIHLVHHMSKVTNDPKLTKVITRTINVINPDGTTDSIVQTVRFVQTATKDDVTNSGSYMNDWKNVGAESFAEYNVPEIAGYTSSKTKVEKLTPKFGDQNVIVNIDYIKKSQINPVKPVKPIVTPIEKDNKEQSANKQQTVTAEPNSKPKVTQEIKQPVSKTNKTNGKILERKDRQTYKFQGQTVTMKKVVNAKEAGHINKIKAKKAALPQTGNDEAKTTAIIASGLAVDLSLIGLAGLKKKRSN